MLSQHMRFILINEMGGMCKNATQVEYLETQVEEHFQQIVAHSITIIGTT